MPITEIDHLWFKANAGREYRSRRETPAEVATWEVPPREGFMAWRIVRRSDGAAVSYGFPKGEPYDDDDMALAQLFDQLSEDAA